MDDGWAVRQLRTLVLPDTLPWPLLVQQGLGEAGPAEVREGWERGAMKGGAYGGLGPTGRIQPVPNSSCGDITGPPGQGRKCPH